MSLYFLRHCQSRFNAGLGDDYDVDLSDYGRDQALRIKGDFTMVLCSPLKRALNTLRLSQIKYDKLVMCHECREHKNVHKCDYFQNEDRIEETEAQIRSRVRDFKKSLKTYLEGMKEGESLLVVSHAWFINRILKLDRYLDNGEIYHVKEIDKVLKE